MNKKDKPDQLIPDNVETELIKFGFEENIFVGDDDQFRNTTIYLYTAMHFVFFGRIWQLDKWLNQFSAQSALLHHLEPVG